jgi:hypothetical protein
LEPGIIFDPFLLGGYMNVCDKCGLVVGNQITHGAWHTLLNDNFSIIEGNVDFGNPDYTYMELV